MGFCNEGGGVAIEQVKLMAAWVLQIFANHFSRESCGG